MAFKGSPSSQHQHCTDEAQKAETVLSAVIYIYIFIYIYKYIYINIYIYIYIYILLFDVVPDFKWYSSLYLLQLCFVWPRAATLIRQNQRVTVN